MVGAKKLKGKKLVPGDKGSKKDNCLGMGD